MSEYTFLTTPQGQWRVLPELWEDPHIRLLLEENADDGREPVRFLSLQDFAKRVALAVNTLTNASYELPAPDVLVGEGPNAIRGWTTRTIDAWWASRKPAPERAKGLPRPGAWKHGEKLWDAAPAADELVLVACTKGTANPSGTVQAGPPRNIVDLRALAAWRWKGTTSVERQIWVTPALCELWGLHEAGSSLEVEAILAKALHWTPEGLGEAEKRQVRWELDKTLRPWWFRFKTPGGPVLLAVPIPSNDPKDKWRFEVGPYGEVGTDSELPSEDDAQSAEFLGKRIAWLTVLTGEVPCVGWNTAGAESFLTQFYAKRATNRKRIDATPLPVALTQDTLEPPTHWDTPSHKKKLDEGVEIEVDQRMAFLAAAAASQLGFGELREHIGGSAYELLPDDPKRQPPFGAWLVTTPPMKELGLQRLLPPPHQSMSWDEPSTFWATTRTLTHLCEKPEDGGAGLTYELLDIQAAWVQHEQTQLLRPWADMLRDELKKMGSDPDAAAYRYFVKQMYVSLFGYLDHPNMPKKYELLHQPLWYATIRADCRRRANRFAAQIHREHTWRPDRANTDAFVYRLPPGTDLSPFEDTTGNLGKYRIKRHETLVPEEAA